MSGTSNAWCVGEMKLYHVPRKVRARLRDGPAEGTVEWIGVGAVVVVADDDEHLVGPIGYRRTRHGLLLCQRGGGPAGV